MKKAGFAILFVAISVLSRIIPHEPNVTAVLAMSFFAGVYLNWISAIFVALASLILSDVFLGFYGARILVFNYVAVIVSIAFGMLSRRRVVESYGGAVISLSLIESFLCATAFFAISNLGVFLFSGLYLLTWDGLVLCYTLALPFFRNAFLGTLVYSVGFLAVRELWYRAQLLKVWRHCNGSA